MAGTELRPGRVETVDVTCNVEGLADPLRISFATNNPKTELLLATGFGEANVAQIAADLGDRGISVAVYNITSPSKVESSDALIEQILLRGTAEAVHSLNRGAGRHIDTPVIGVGHSRGSFEQIRSAYENSALWKLLIQSASVGLNIAYLGEDYGHEAYKKERRAFNNGLRATGLLIPRSPEDPHKRTIAIDYTALMWGLMACLKYSVKQNSEAMVNHLRQLRLLHRVFVGEDDPLVMPNKLEDKFGSDGFVVKLPGFGHESLMTKRGIDYIAKVIKLGLSEEMHFSLPA